MRYLLACLLMTLCITSAYAETQYVRSDTPVIVRMDPNDSATELGTLSDHDPVAILQTDNTSDFTLIRTEKGLEGWVPNAILQADNKTSGLASVAQEASSEVKNTVDTVKTDLHALSDTASKPLANNLSVRGQPEAKPTMQGLSQSPATLRQDSPHFTQEWLNNPQVLLAFLSGAGILLVGFLLGFLMGKRDRKRSRW